MTKLMTTAAVLVALLAPATADNRMPAKFIGNWCSSGNFMYKHGKCKDGKANDRWMTIRVDGFDMHETTCKLLKGVSDREGKFLMMFRCSGEGETRLQSYWMSIRGSELTMSETKQQQ
jgi:hypothetical protein